MNKSAFTELFAKKMTRYEFLLHISLVFITISGISALLQVLSNPNLTKKQANATKGFSSGPYGV